jgi:photosystem II stability/assembly factor-like uncharacterized protein
MRSAIARTCLVSLLPFFAFLPVIGQESAPPQMEPSIQAPLAPRALLLDVGVADGHLVAVGERGHILISDDGGQNWVQQSAPTRATLTAVHFHDRDLGWAVGHDAVILRTTDGGVSWEPVHFAPEEERPLLDIWFSDAENGFAIGAYGFFLVTEDGGTTWESRLISEDDFHLNHFSRSANGRQYIAAEAGEIYRSDDGGETWDSLPSPYIGSFFATLPLEGETVLVFGLRGHLYRSEDAGSSWTEVDTPTEQMLTDGVLLEDGTIVIVGLGGTVLVSPDGGRSFKLRQQADRKGISSAVALRSDALIVVGEYGARRLPLDELSDSGGGE